MLFMSYNFLYPFYFLGHENDGAQQWCSLGGMVYRLIYSDVLFHNFTYHCYEGRKLFKNLRTEFLAFLCRCACAVVLLHMVIS